MGSWGVRIAIIAIIIVGGFVLRDRLSSSAGDLKVGDCFDEPATGGEISDVQHHPCTEAHTAEVVFIGLVGILSWFSHLDLAGQHGVGGRQGGCKKDRGGHA